MADRNELIMAVKSERNFERAKFRFEFCGLICGLWSEVVEAYDGIDWVGIMGGRLGNEFFVCEELMWEFEDLIFI